MDRNEEREQARLVKWTHKREVRAVLPALAFLHHSPNGGQRTARAGAQMVALGTKRGWPDLVLPLPPPLHGLAIEMKSTTGRVSEEQTGWLEHLAECGWSCHVCRSAEDARLVILSFFGIAPDSVMDLEPPK